MREIASYDDAVSCVVSALSESLSPGLAREVTEQFLLYCDGEFSVNWSFTEPPPPVHYEIGAPFDFHNGPWFIKERELADLKFVSRTVLALAVLRPVTVRGDFGVLVISALLALWRLRRRGVTASPLQMAVLIQLRASKSLTTPELAVRLEAHGNWSASDVQEALKELSAIRVNDGSVVALVQQDADERWSTDARGLWDVPMGFIG